jgi:light-regulated signal transduction histidine kinase (bacteriophytochrome)/CheY-like chemotaxis protein
MSGVGRYLAQCCDAGAAVEDPEEAAEAKRVFKNPFKSRPSKQDHQASLEATGEPVTNTVFTKQDLYGCDAESIHTCGKIQGGTGHVLFFKYPEGSIVAADEKICDVLWVKAPETVNGVSEMIGVPLESCIPEAIYNCIMEAVQGMKNSFVHRTFQFLSHEAVPYAVTLATTYRDYSVMSVEIEVDSTQASNSFHSTLGYLNRIMEFYANESIVKAACDTIFDLLEGYDRGMVYKFHDDYSGEVIHEIKRDSVKSSYMGLRFPALEIPPPIRQLYIKNVFRFIRDVDVADVNIVSNEEIDLTHCRTRACNRCHIAYMRNMGLRASMSLAILVENRLWGIFAFHGYDKAYKPTLHQRIASETIASMVSARVESLVRKKTSARIISLGETLMTWSQAKTFGGNLSSLGEQILEVVDADVLVGRSEGETVVIGDKALAPTDSCWGKLAVHPDSKLLVLNDYKQMEEHGILPGDCLAPGVVYFRHDSTEIFLGRNARSKDVAWGGNPDEPRLYVDGKLNPRTSFGVFMQKARMEARAWSPQDENVVLILRDGICSERSHDWMVALLKTDIEEANMRYYSAIDRAQDNSHFFAQLCHELRTPFHGVMGCLNILHDSVDQMPSADVKDLVSTAISSGNHMLNLLNDILVKSKNKYLSTRNVGSTVQYQTLAKESVDGLQCLAANLQIKFTREIIPNAEKIFISTDRTKVIQIVSNIVNNAIKFAGQGLIQTRFNLVDRLDDAIDVWENDTKDHAGCALTFNEGEMLTSIADVRTAVRGRPRGDINHKWLCVSVADSGCGMKPQELVEMFEPYAVSEKGTDSRFQGTGLGLYITVTLCQQLEGFIACASTSGVGTVFSIGVPVEIKQAEDDGSVGTAASVEEDEGIPVCGPIAIIDDNRVNVKILHRALSLELKRAGLGIEVLKAYGGEAAVDLYKERLPSVVIIDYHMPGIDGVGATKAIRKYENDQNLTPAYIMSYTADMSDEANAVLMASGSNAVMAKPPPAGFVAQLVKRMRVMNTKNTVLDHLKWTSLATDEESAEKFVKRSSSFDGKEAIAESNIPDDEAIALNGAEPFDEKNVPALFSNVDGAEKVGERNVPVLFGKDDDEQAGGPSVVSEREEDASGHFNPSEREEDASGHFNPSEREEDASGHFSPSLFTNSFDDAAGELAREANEESVIFGTDTSQPSTLSAKGEGGNTLDILKLASAIEHLAKPLSTRTSVRLDVKRIPHEAGEDTTGYRIRHIAQDLDISVFDAVKEACQDNLGVRILKKTDSVRAGLELENLQVLFQLGDNEEDQMKHTVQYWKGVSLRNALSIVLKESQLKLPILVTYESVYRVEADEEDAV